MNKQRTYMDAYRKNFMLRFTLILFGVCVLVLLMSLVMDKVFNGIVVDVLELFSPLLAKFVVEYKYQILLVICCIILLAVMSVALYFFSRKLNLIIDSIYKVFRKEEGLIELPNDFADVAAKLNTIKLDRMLKDDWQRNEERRKSDLIVCLAHDLKTPLTGVVGYLGLLKDEKELTAETRERYTNTAYKEALRLEELVGEFFEVTRYSLNEIQLTPVRLDLTLMLNQLTEEFYPSFTAKGLTCELHAADGLFTMADPDKLARVFENVLRNAINYSTENTAIELFAERHGDELEVICRNRCPRIPENKLELLFERLYRLDSSRSTRTGGAGLGLAIARQIVTLHGGSITARSNDEYTEFVIRLKAAEVRTESN